MFFFFSDFGLPGNFVEQVHERLLWSPSTRRRSTSAEQSVALKLYPANALIRVGGQQRQRLEVNYRLALRRKWIIFGLWACASHGPVAVIFFGERGAPVQSAYPPLTWFTLKVSTAIFGQRIIGML